MSKNGHNTGDEQCENYIKSIWDSITNANHQQSTFKEVFHWILNYKTGLDINPGPVIFYRYFFKSFDTIFNYG